MKTYTKILSTFFVGAGLVFSTLAIAQDEMPAQTLFTNVQIFDGVNEERTTGNVLVESNLIKQVSAEAISASGATVIDGGVPRAINAGTIIGPRIYPSAAFPGGRGGHADFANFTSLMGDASNMGRLNMSQEVDGVDAIR